MKEREKQSTQAMPEYCLVCDLHLDGVLKIIQKWSSLEFLAGGSVYVGFGII
jgi:hypothetical protein